ncbi:MAG: DUF4177 domain-containing protein [Lachnospiraceae bacterium]|nr:DUF4177 domain-containing protein [Lachnospiraceae bacterium]
MKDYKLVYLNKKMKLTREKDLEQAQEVLNQYAAEGWELMQIISPADLGGALVGVFFRINETETRRNV